MIRYWKKDLNGCPFKIKINAQGTAARFLEPASYYHVSYSIPPILSQVYNYGFKHIWRSKVLQQESKQRYKCLFCLTQPLSASLSFKAV